MGTRHLIIIYHAGKYKLAQYGQWDGYPDGQGKVVLKFLSDPDNLTKLVANLNKLYTPTDEECNGINTMVESLRRQAAARLSQVYRSEIQVTEEEHLKLISDSRGSLLKDVCPSMSRDIGAGILYLIANAAKPIPVHLDLDFIADTLLCEFAYVVDIDASVLEVYSSQVRSGKTRFHELDCARGRDPERFGPGLLGTWPLGNLPSEDGFLSEIRRVTANDSGEEKEDATRDEDEHKKEEEATVLD